MKIQSAKAKGRRAAEELKYELLAFFPELLSDDIVITSSSVTGEDLKLSPLARRLFPFTIEVKNQEKLNIWKAIEQAKFHGRGKETVPLLAFHRNRSKLYVCLEVSDFLRMLQCECRKRVWGRHPKTIHKTVKEWYAI